MTRPKTVLGGGDVNDSLHEGAACRGYQLVASLEGPRRRARDRRSARTFCRNHTLRQRGVMMLSLLVDEDARKFSLTDTDVPHPVEVAMARMDTPTIAGDEIDEDVATLPRLVGERAPSKNATKCSGVSDLSNVPRQAT